MSCMQTKISPPSSSWERAEGLVSNLCGNSWLGESASSPPSGAIVGHASALWSQAGSDHGRCQMYICDILSEASIVERLAPFGDLFGYFAGVLRYPNRAIELSFDEFAPHLHTNTIGPTITAQKLLQTNIPVSTIIFKSSDSGSTGNFQEIEDEFVETFKETLANTGRPFVDSPSTRRPKQL